MATALELISHSPKETQQIGRVLGKGASPGDIFLLMGPLGAGKTCLTQGIAWGVGVHEYARSPTFVLMARYKGRFPMHHIDLFRIDDPLEAQDLGMEEYLGGEGVCVVEWADRTVDLFPPESLWIQLEYGDGERERHISIQAKGGHYHSLLKSLRKTYKADGS